MSSELWWLVAAGLAGSALALVLYWHKRAARRSTDSLAQMQRDVPVLQNPMTPALLGRWAIALEGNQIDLRDALRSFASNGPVRVGEIRRPDGTPATAIVADELGGVSTTEEAHEIGTRLVDWLNGALFVQNADRQRLTLAAVVERDAAGTWIRGIAPGAGTAKGRSRAYFVGQTIGPDGQPLPSPPQPHDRWIELATSDVVAADVLTYLSRELDWFDIYKAFEMMRDDLNRVVGTNNYASIGWPNVKRFQASAQVYRHAMPKWPVGYNMKTAMGLDEARKLVRELAEKWLNWRVSRMPP